MLVSLGRQPRNEEVVDLLFACHRRILEHLALARRLANAPVGTPAESVRDAAGRVRRYFGEAFPLHRADEETDIFPRLRGLDAKLDLALDELERDHDDHEAIVTAVVEVCALLQQDPALVAEHAAQLRDLARRLETELGEHIALEERTVFPAIMRIAQADRDAIVARMRARRES